METYFLWTRIGQAPSRHGRFIDLHPLLQFSNSTKLRTKKSIHRMRLSSSLSEKANHLRTSPSTGSMLQESSRIDRKTAQILVTQDDGN